MWIDTWVGSETGSRPCANLNHFYGAFLLGSFWPIFLSCLVLSPFGTSQGLPMCTGISQPRWMPVKSVWQVDTTPLLTFKKFSSWEDLLDLENEKYVVSYLLSGQGPASSSRLSYYRYFGVFYAQETNSNGLGAGVPYLPPASDEPQILQFLES